MLGIRFQNEWLDSQAPPPIKNSNCQISLNQFQALGVPGRMPEATEKGICPKEGRGKTLKSYFHPRQPVPTTERAASTFLSVASDPCQPRPEVLPHRQMLHPSTGFPDGSVFIKTKAPKDSHRVIQTEAMFTHSALQGNLHGWQRRWAEGAEWRRHSVKTDWQPGSGAPCGCAALI